MKKKLKIIVKSLLGFVLFLAVLMLALPLWVGPVATMVANKVVPGRIGADFNLAEFGLNPYSGKLHVGGLEMSNPEGFAKENCVDLMRLDVDVAMMTVLSNKIRIEEIVVESLTISTDVRGGNFKKIAENASAKDTAKERPAESGDAAKRDDAEKKSGKDAPKVVIDKLVLKDLKVKLNKVPIVIPDLTITGIGEDSESGVTFTEAWETVLEKILSSAGALAGALGDLGKGTISVGAEAGGAVINLGADTVGAAAGAVKDLGSAAKDTGKAIKHMFRKNK